MPGLGRAAFGCVVALAVLGTSCDGSARDATATGPRDDTILHPQGELDVLFQVGDYEVGVIPDEYVFGPELVVYGDGSVYAELAGGVSKGVMQSRLVRGSMSEEDIQRLLRGAAELPSAAEPIGEAPSDGSPLHLAGGTWSWDIYDLEAEPYASYVDRLLSAVEAIATAAWTPARWIEQPYGGPCSIVARSTVDPLFDAPVYPHLLDEYLLGGSC